LISSCCRIRGSVSSPKSAAWMFAAASNAAALAHPRDHEQSSMENRRNGRESSCRRRRHLAKGLLAGAARAACRVPRHRRCFERAILSGVRQCSGTRRCRAPPHSDPSSGPWPGSVSSAPGGRSAGQCRIRGRGFSAAPHRRAGKQSWESRTSPGRSAVPVRGGRHPPRAVAAGSRPFSRCLCAARLRTRRRAGIRARRRAG
jgi:hypothetical protein